MSAPTTTTVALKEWGAVVHALLQGRQTVLLRKGGIHEKAFALPRVGTEGATRVGTEGTSGGDSGAFVLFPTVAHSHRERVRDEHADLLDLGSADVNEERLTLRAGVQVVDVVQAARPEGLAHLADLHIWTDESLQRDRLDFRPKHPLAVLVVRAVALPEPVTLERADEYGGCRSWVELPPVWDGRVGTAAVGDDRLDADAARVRRAVG